MKKGVLEHLTNFTGKHPCQGFLFNKIPGLRDATLLKKRLWHRCFPVNFANFVRASFLQNTFGRSMNRNNARRRTDIMVTLMRFYSDFCLLLLHITFSLAALQKYNHVSFLCYRNQKS